MEDLSKRPLRLGQSITDLFYLRDVVTVGAGICSDMFVKSLTVPVSIPLVKYSGVGGRVVSFIGGIM